MSQLRVNEIKQYTGDVVYVAGSPIGAFETILSGSFTGSFTGDGNFDRLSINGDVTLTGSFNHLGNTNRTGSIFHSGSTNQVGNTKITGSLYVSNNIWVDGKITAQEFHTELVSSSIIYDSGSTKFGDTQDDIHSFTGSVNITGSHSLVGNSTQTGNITQIGNTTQTGSYYQSGSSVQIGNVTLVGDSIITGSISQSGSYSQIGNTNQTGNVTLLGDSRITGSIFQSGSTTQIGNIIQTGSYSQLGNFTITGSVIHSGSNTQVGNSTISGSLYILRDVWVDGKVTAQEFHSEFVSSSIIYESGSTKFGDTTDDVHSFTGSVNISGSYSLNGPTVQTGNITHIGNYTITGSISQSGSYTQIGNTTQTGNVTLIGDSNITGSIFQSGSYTQIGNTTQTGNTLQTGNVTLVGDSNITGSISQSGSYTQIGDYTVTGSINHLGDYIRTGNTVQVGDIVFDGGLTVTGSFNHTGSLYRIGNTTLEGNVEHTGSSSQLGNVNLTGNLEVIGDSNFTGSIHHTGSHSQIGNSTQVGNTVQTGSIFHSGSVNQKGNTTQTGSYLHLGDNKQTGNVTLIGDTQHTGSLKQLGNTTQTGDLTVIGTSVFSGSIQHSGSYLHNGNTIHTGNTVQTGDITLTGDSNITGHITQSGNMKITGNILHTGNTQHTGSVSIKGGFSISDDLVVGGKVTAQEFHTEFVSSSIIYESGSTKFGNSNDDRHEFTGSVNIDGLVTLQDQKALVLPATNAYLQIGDNSDSWKNYIGVNTFQNALYLESTTNVGNPSRIDLIVDFSTIASFYSDDSSGTIDNSKLIHFKDTDFQVNGDDIYVDFSSGRTGFGTTTPSHLVDIQGDLNVSGTIYGLNIISGSSQVDHDATTNFVADEHVAHSSITFTAGNGLTGGGTLADNRTFNVGQGTGITVSADAISTNDSQIVHDNLSGFVTNEHIDHSVVNIIAGSGLTGGGDITIDRTLNIGQGTGITVAADAISTNDSQIVHDNLSGFVADEHIDHSTVSVLAGNGLTGGGDITIDRTLNVGAGNGITVAADTVAVNAVANGGITVAAAGISVDEANVDHDSLQNFVANEHINHSNVTLTAGNGLTGGGDITTNRTFTVQAVANGGISVGGTGISVDEANVDHDSLQNFVANEHIDHSGVSIIAGNGLTGGGDLTTNCTLNIGAGNGITVNADDIALASSTAGNGLTYAAGVLAVGAGTGITVAADAVSVNVSGFMSNGADNRVLTATGTNAMTAESGLTYNGSTLSVTGAISSTGDITGNTSDDRLKDRLGVIENPLEKVSKLSGFTYRYNDLAKSHGFTYEDTRVGLSAQDLLDVLPEATAPAPFDTDENGNSKTGENYLTVRYERVVPLLVEAIKELQREIEELKKK